MTTKKLALNKERLRNLQPVELRKAAGGGGWTCMTTHILIWSFGCSTISTISGDTVYEPIETVTCSGATGSPPA